MEAPVPMFPREATEAQSMALIMHERDEGRRAEMLAEHYARFGEPNDEPVPEPVPGAQYQ